MVEVERQFVEHQEAQAQLALMAQTNRDRMVAVIAAEEHKLDEQIDKLSREKELSRKKLVGDLRAGEWLLPWWFDYKEVSAYKEHPLNKASFFLQQIEEINYVGLSELIVTFDG